MKIVDETPAACVDELDLFFGTVDDGRTEEGREEREELASTICFSCIYRVGCLEKSLVLEERFGVFGGMGEGQRRRFRKHLAAEGYGREIPSGLELVASLNEFYRHNPQPNYGGGEPLPDAFSALPLETKKQLMEHFRREGYETVPSGPDLTASLHEFERLQLAA